MVGRRAADQVLTPRTRAAAVGALALAVVAGGVLFRTFRADGFEVARPVAVPPSPAVAAAGMPPPATPEPDVTASLRAADRGRALLARGEVKEAVSVLAAAARALPADAGLAHLYGTALWEFGARDLAVFQFQRAVRLAPQTEAYRSDLARALQATGRPAAAARLLYGPAPGAGTGSVPAGAADAADLGGAGAGTFKGRRSFTDADLRGRAAGPLPGDGRQ